MDWPKFLVTTAKKFLYFDGSSFHTLHEGKGIYYGITWDKNSLYLGNRKGIDRGDPEISIFSSDLRRVGSIPRNFNDHHQILYTGGKLYVTDTGSNSVIVCEGGVGKGVAKNWTSYTYDKNHINSIHFDRSRKKFWVSYHNYLKRTNEYNSSRVVMLDDQLSSVEWFIDIGFNIHNCFAWENELYVCNSEFGTLLKVDLDTGGEEEFYVGHWSRGLAVSDDLVLVGSSVKSDNRISRLEGDCEIRLLDRNTFSTLDTTILPDQGAIFEIRMIDIPDYAHNDISFPGIF